MKINLEKLFADCIKLETCKEKGFTIIELVISIFILSIGIVGIFNALSIITILTSDSGDRLTATYLAQEGMEIVRNVRDTNWLNTDTANASGSGTPYSWLDGLADSTDVANSRVKCDLVDPCEADYTSGSMSNRTDYLDMDSNGFYCYPSSCPSSPATKFKRKIIINETQDIHDTTNPPYHIIAVTVEVSWDKKATILSGTASADDCCPDSNDKNCPLNVSNCIKLEGTFYNWYNANISVQDVLIYDYNQPSITATPPEPTEGQVYTLTPGKTYSLTAHIDPSDATNQGVSWNSDNPSCVDVTSTGVITASANPCSPANIKVTTADGNHSFTELFKVVGQ